MKRVFTILMMTFCFWDYSWAGYVDHRGHNVDSLETVIAKWTAKDIADADELQLGQVAKDLEELIWGFNNVNPVKSEYYARVLLGISEKNGWTQRESWALRMIGQHFWASAKYDSAAVYFEKAIQVADRMEDSSSKDDVISALHGAVGNLYSSMDSLELAMAHYAQAGALFFKHGWHNSSSVLYYNMGETMMGVHEYSKAEEYYKESMRYARLAEDSLAIAGAFKGLGGVYVETGKVAKATRNLAEANRYYANHEDEELRARMESLDFTEQVLSLQNRRLRLLVILLLFSLAMTALAFGISIKLKAARKEKEELTLVLEDTMESITPVKEKKAVNLKPKGLDVLGLISKGYTNADIADAMCLSPDAIKWYKKKLFLMFDVSNSAELVKVASEEGII